MSIYEPIYKKLCETRKNNKQNYSKFSGLHKHHIIPRHSNGEDSEDNYTYLTIKEHILAHFMLWKIYKNPQDLRSLKMLGAKLTVEQRRIVGKWCLENEIGFFNKKYTEDTYYHTARTNASYITQKNNKQGIHNPETFSKFASLGGKVGGRSQKNNKQGIHNPENFKKNASLGGKALVGMICVTNGTHRTRIRKERLDEFLSKGYIKGFTLFS